MTIEKMVSVWTLKPWWCQPWSILLTGIGAIALSWFLIHRVWVTGLLAVPMVVWMGYFLLVYPKLFEQMQAQSPVDTSHQ
jgi:membrane protein YdbS with pleckstrin-like domain